MKRHLVFGLLVLVTAFALACAGSEPIPLPTSTPTPTPTATALSLNEYLVLALRINIDMASFTNLFSSSQTLEKEEAGELLIQLAREMSRSAGAGLETLSNVTPAGEAETYHETLLGVLRAYGHVGQTLTEGLEADDPSRLEAAGLDFTALSRETLSLDKEGQRLIITALGAEPGDPTNAYLIAGTEARIELTAASDEVFSKWAVGAASARSEADLNALYTSLFEENTAGMERFENRWVQLTPPAQAQELHRRQAESIGKGIAVSRRLLRAIQAQDNAALLEARQSQIDAEVESAKVLAAWNELVIEALARGFGD